MGVFQTFANIIIYRVFIGLVCQEQIIESTKSENINLQERIKVIDVPNESIDYQQDKISIKVHDSRDLHSEEKSALSVAKESLVFQHDKNSIKKHDVKDFYAEEKPPIMVGENMINEEKENFEQISNEMKSKSIHMSKSYNLNPRKRQLTEPEIIPIGEPETGSKTSLNLKQSLVGVDAQENHDKVVSNNETSAMMTNDRIGEKIELKDFETIEKMILSTTKTHQGTDLESSCSHLEKSKLVKSNTVNEKSNTFMASSKTDSYQLESGNNRISSDDNDQDVGIVTRMVVDAVSNGDV